MFTLISRWCLRICEFLLPSKKFFACISSKRRACCVGSVYKPLVSFLHRTAQITCASSRRHSFSLNLPDGHQMFCLDLLPSWAPKGQLIRLAESRLINHLFGEALMKPFILFLFTLNVMLKLAGQKIKASYRKSSSRSNLLLITIPRYPGQPVRFPIIWGIKINCNWRIVKNKSIRVFKIKHYICLTFFILANKLKITFVRTNERDCPDFASRMKSEGRLQTVVCD